MSFLVFSIKQKPTIVKNTNSDTKDWDKDFHHKNWARNTKYYLLNIENLHQDCKLSKLTFFLKNIPLASQKETLKKRKK